MGKVAHSLNGLPPSVSLNTSDNVGGQPEVSARNHRSFFNAAKIKHIFKRTICFVKKFFVSLHRKF